MRRASSFGLSGLALVAAAGRARADHEHAPTGPGADPPAGALSLTAGAIVGAYDTTLFAGDYQGLAGAVGYAHGRFAASVTGAAYHLTRNGATIRGVGDVTLHGQVIALARGALAAGAMLGVSLPTGDDREGLGMGHPMVMPGAFATWRSGRLGAAAAAGYHRGLGDAAAHADHGGGAWPLVDPMGFDELGLSVAGDYALARALRVGVIAAGALPLDDTDARLTAGVHASWIAGDVETALAIAGGLAGDPYTLRGTLSATVRWP